MPESSIVVRPKDPDSPSYTASARLQAAGLRPAIELFVDAAATVPLPAPPQPIVLADYGAATAHNALLPITAAVAALRKRAPKEQPILVAHTDRPDNDFTALFTTLSDDPDSYLRTDNAVYASAVGRSYFTQILPSHSVTLGWSAWAVQWLSESLAVGDHVVPALSGDEKVRAESARRAAHDWHEFVAFRGRELTHEGRLVVLTIGRDEAGELGMRPLVDALYTTLQTLVGADLITTDELTAMSLPLVGRNEDDLRAPFAPKGRFESLSIEHVEIDADDDRFWQQYRTDQDAGAFGARWAGFLRASVFDILAAALDGGRTDDRVPTFYDQLESGIAERLAAAPEQVRVPMAKVVLRKDPRTPR